MSLWNRDEVWGTNGWGGGPLAELLYGNFSPTSGVYPHFQEEASLCQESSRVGGSTGGWGAVMPIKVSAPVIPPLSPQVLRGGCRWEPVPGPTAATCPAPQAPPGLGQVKGEQRGL